MLRSVPVYGQKSQSLDRDIQNGTILVPASPRFTDHVDRAAINVPELDSDLLVCQSSALKGHARGSCHIHRFKLQVWKLLHPFQSQQSSDDKNTKILARLGET